MIGPLQYCFPSSCLVIFHDTFRRSHISITTLRVGSHRSHLSYCIAFIESTYYDHITGNKKRSKMSFFSSSTTDQIIKLKVPTKTVCDLSLQYSRYNGAHDSYSIWWSGAVVLNCSLGWGLGSALVTKLFVKHWIYSESQEHRAPNPCHRQI